MIARDATEIKTRSYYTKLYTNNLNNLDVDKFIKKVQSTKFDMAEIQA